jgi:biopolymer transport protein ExbB
MNTIDVVKDVLLRSGASWVLWFLGFLSLVSVAIIVERLLVFRRLGVDLKSTAERLDAKLGNADYSGAIDELARTESVAGSIAAAGLRLADRGPAAAEKAMESAVALERSRLERWLAYLGTVGNNAPFVGLFGTVVGVVGAFEKLGQSPAAKAGAGQAANQAVMSSIAEALVATAVGILVALPAVAAYNFFQRWIAQLLSGAEVLSKLVLAYLAGDRREG